MPCSCPRNLAFSLIEHREILLLGAIAKLYILSEACRRSWRLDHIGSVSETLHLHFLEIAVTLRT
jgi:hypothetical protein